MFKSVQKKRIHLYLIVFDLLATFSSFLIFYSGRFSNPLLTASQSLISSERFLTIALFIILFNFIFDLYEVRYWINAMFSPVRIVLSVLASALTIFALIYFFSDETKDIIGRGVFISSLSLYLFLSLSFRWCLQRYHKVQVKRSHWLFIGDKSYIDEFEKECSNSLCSFNFSWLDTNSVDLEKEIGRTHFRGIIVCGTPSNEITQALIKARLHGMEIFDYQYFNELLWGKVAVKFLNPSWFVFSSGFSLVHKKTMNIVKTSGDVILSLTLLALSSPLLLACIIIIRLESKGSPIYKQERVGLNGKTFTILKLRTMRADAEKDGAQWAKEGDTRITFIGKFLRFTRIDEIPQLINILRGEMSFIGPRPERPEFTKELEKSIPYYDFRHLVKPGLTGWAQVMYQYGASEDDAIEKLKFELFYIKNYSIWLDVIP